MEITNILEEKVWGEKLSQFSSASFLQSWDWGVFQELLGNKTTRVSVEESMAQYYFVKSRFSYFLYCPRGPLSTFSESFSSLLDQLIKDAKENRVDFVLVEPPIDTGIVGQTLVEKGFIKQKSTTQPESTSIVSLTQDVDSIYSKIRKTTRQMIRKAIENKVEVKSYQDLSRWNDFVQLFSETTKRQKFTAHNLAYIKKQFACFEKNKKIKMYIAEKDGKTLAGSIILSYAKTSVYLHAASNNLGRDLGAAHLLVWTAIQDAKKEGNNYFDLWGIAPESDSNHPWRGITIFKKGFGGGIVSYPGSFVLPVRPIRYKFYLFINFIRVIPPIKVAQRILLSIIPGGN